MSANSLNLLCDLFSPNSQGVPFSTEQEEYRHSFKRDQFLFSIAENASDPLRPKAIQTLWLPYICEENNPLSCMYNRRNILAPHWLEGARNPNSSFRVQALKDLLAYPNSSEMGFDDVLAPFVLPFFFDLTPDGKEVVLKRLRSSQKAVKIRQTRFCFRICLDYHRCITIHETSSLKHLLGLGFEERKLRKACGLKLSSSKKKISEKAESPDETAEKIPFKLWIETLGVVVNYTVLFQRDRAKGLGLFLEKSVFQDPAAQQP